MKNSIKKTGLKQILILWLIAFACFSCSERENKSNPLSPVERVNVRIGAVSHMLVPTYPTVHLPNSMVRIYPYTTPGINDNFLAPEIRAFPVNIPSHRHNPLSMLMVASGKATIHPDSMSSTYDHDFEISTPYYYSVLLENSEIWVDFSVTSHGAVYRFRCEKGGDVNLLIQTTGKGKYEHGDSSVISGYDSQEGLTQYLYGRTETIPVNTIRILPPEKQAANSENASQANGILMQYQVPEDGSIVFRYAISYVSAEDAKHHYTEELQDKTIEQLSAEAKKKWDMVLGKIQVQGGSTDQQKVFYTSLYRCYERMVDISENGRYFSPFDRKIHNNEGHDFFVDDWSWDTYRTLHPLRIILDPDLETAMINSYIRMYEQSGWMPSFPTVYGDMGAMIGHHQAAIITDAWNKGLRNFDGAKAYEGLKKNALFGTRIPWREGPITELDRIYLEKGYFPGKKPADPETELSVDSFEGRQSVAVTLEHTYDDWCLSRLASGLGNREEKTAFAKRGQNYRNLYNSQTGFMSPRSASGEWIESFDPKAPAGIGGREYFAESNAWTYTWFVPHDLDELVDLMGGKEAAILRLDQLFNEPPGRSKWMYLGYMPDATGLTGLFPMGNEPGFHIPYIYNFLGAPWKTQKLVRQLMDTWFRNDLMGVCGDEDGGAMSAWYVFSALGFYPFCPGIPAYVLGSPVFEKAVIDTGAGKKFTIWALNVSNQNKYIQSASLNGKPLDMPWFSHENLMGGGELVLEMGPRPNTKWGRKADFKLFYDYVELKK